MTEIPDYCQLTEDERDVREPNVREMVSRIESVDALEDGYRMRFPGDQETLEIVTQFAVNERRCCSMATYQLTFEGEEAPVEFTVRGPAEMIDDMGTVLGLDQAARNDDVGA